MTEAQVFQLLGVAYTAIGIGAVADPRSFERIVQWFDKERALLFVSGILAMVVGYVLAIQYGTDWQWSRKSILGAIGYAALLKSIMMLAMPQWSIGTMKWFMKRVPHAVYAWLILLLGLILVAIGCGYV